MRQGCFCDLGGQVAINSRSTSLFIWIIMLFVRSIVSKILKNMDDGNDDDNNNDDYGDDY